MVRLSTLYSQKAKAEEVAMQKPLTARQILAYDTICKRICVMERLKFLTTTAPRTMDPKKIQDHWLTAKAIIKEIDPHPDDEQKQLLTKAGKFFNEYKATSVQSYSTQFNSFAKQFLASWNRKNEYN